MLLKLSNKLSEKYLTPFSHGNRYVALMLDYRDIRLHPEASDPAGLSRRLAEYLTGETWSGESPTRMTGTGTTRHPDVH